MNRRQDSIKLDKNFPFQINSVLLRAEDYADEFFHWHSYFEITLIVRGTGCYYVNGQAYEVEPGDIIIFNNAEVHGWQVLQREMEVVAMVFNPELIVDRGFGADLEYLEPFIERGRNFKNKVGRQELGAGEIGATMGEIMDEWRGKREGFRLMIKADILKILTMLVRHYHDDSREAELPSEKKKALKRLQAAFDYIDDNYCGKVTLKEAADAVYMSPNYFSNYFHKATEISFSDYVTLRRIRKARSLLETTSKSIYEIAMECGFPNSSNFYRLYKKHTGESPRNGR